MTNEEAVKIIKRERDSMRRLVDDCNLPITGGYEYIEAYDMAIEALKAQLPNHSEIPNSSDDLISRQAAIDAVEESRRLNHHQDGKEACAHEYEHRHFLKILRDLPSAEPKKGKWVRYDDDWLKTMCKCSECGAMIDINEKYRNFFCYHCGARMDGEWV